MLWCGPSRCGWASGRMPEYLRAFRSNEPKSGIYPGRHARDGPQNFICTWMDSSYLIARVTDPFRRDRPPTV